MQLGPGFQLQLQRPVRPYNISYSKTINDAFAGLWDQTFWLTLINEARVNAAGWRWNQIADNPQSTSWAAPGQHQPDRRSRPLQSDAGHNLQLLWRSRSHCFRSVDSWLPGCRDQVRRPARDLVGWRKSPGSDHLNQAPYNPRSTDTLHNVWDFLNHAPEAETGVFNPLRGTPTIHRQDNRQDIWGLLCAG